jgi:hypothetical protein
MSKPHDRIVSRRPDGRWADKRNDAGKAAGIYDTQQAAEAASRARLKNAGGGELTVQNRHGKIARKDTVAPGNDRFPRRG